MQTDSACFREALEESIKKMSVMHDTERIQCVERMKIHCGKNQTEFSTSLSMRSYHEGCLNGYNSVLRMLENQREYEEKAFCDELAKDN